MLTAFTALCAVVLVYSVGLLKLPKREVTLTDLEVECLAAAMTSDARWAGDIEEEVRRGVGLAVIAYSRTHKTDICDVFNRGLTLVPPGYQRPKFLGVIGEYRRFVWYVKHSLEFNEAAWKADFALASELRSVSDAGPATRYVRKERKSDWIAQPPEAIARIKSEQTLLGRAQRNGKEVGSALFFGE